jgi:S-adenosylmethionine:tRNA ribosyltransferase-isomerase
MDLAGFDFALPEELIAQTPLADRAASRMLVVDRARQSWEDRQFRDLPAFLGAGDCLVLNDSRVFPARLFGHRAGVHALPIDRAAREWEALVHPGKKMRVGERVLFAGGLEAEVIARREFGERTLRFQSHAHPGDIYEEFERIGHVPLPPYIKRPDEAGDRERYQTVFAREISRRRCWMPAARVARIWRS